MLDIVERTFKELGEEISYVSLHLQRWWSGMGQGEQLFAVGIMCAALLLLGMRQPVRSKTIGYDKGQVGGSMREFIFAAVVIVVFTFGVDIAIDNFRPLGSVR